VTTPEKIYEEYYGLMMHIALGVLEGHALAEDAVSESFIKIMKHNEKIAGLARHQRKSYIVSIVRTTSLDMLRKRGGAFASKEDPDKALESVADSSIPVLDGLIAREGCESIVDAIKSLPGTLRDVAYLSLVYDQSHEEISSMLGISYDTSKTRLSRAKKLIREKLTEDSNG